MTKFYLISFGIIGALMAVLAIPVFQPYPYLTTDEGELAQYILEQGLPASNCMKLIHFDMMAPSVEDKRMGCIYEYAKKTKDPSACMLIIPNSYGMDCIGASIPPLTCTIGYDMDVWSESFRTTLTECVSGDENVIHHPCCDIAKVAMIMDENDCSQLLSAHLIDECVYNRALKNKEPSDCKKIKGTALAVACEIEAMAIIEFPKLSESWAPRYKTARDVVTNVFMIR